MRAASDLDDATTGCRSQHPLVPSALHDASPNFQASASAGAAASRQQGTLGMHCFQVLNRLCSDSREMDH